MNHEKENLKTNISSIILAYLAPKLDMTVSEYGSVYDSEEYEKILVKIMNLIDDYKMSELLQASLDYRKLQEILAMVLWERGGSLSVTRHTQVAFNIRDFKLHINQNPDHSFTIQVTE